MGNNYCRNWGISMQMLCNVCFNKSIFALVIISRSGNMMSVHQSSFSTVVECIGSEKFRYNSELSKDTLPSFQQIVTCPSPS